MLDERAEIGRSAAERLGALRTSPRWHPQPHQIPPPGDWYGWLMLAGRGAGKTKAASEWMKAHVAGPPCLPGPVPHWISIIAPTLGDAVTSCFEGPSGLRNTDPTCRLVQAPGGTVVRWANGSQAKLFGAHSPEDVERLRAGGNACASWLEEFAAWRYMDQCFDQLRFGLRSGSRPRWIASTTPKPRPLLKRLLAGEIAGVVSTHGTMYDNPHLEQHVKQALEESYKGTQLGAQELYGRLLEEDENALWRAADIEAGRIDDAPDLSRIVVGVDPSGGAGEQGIVVTAKSLAIPHHGFVLADYTCKLSPDGWGRRAVRAAVDFEADAIVVERNYGGDMAVATIRTAADVMGVNVPIKTVTATRGKAVRAQPVAALAAQSRWHHVGVFPELETQLTTWTPDGGWSPDRLDACLVGGTLVKTHRGDVPIELVTTSDRVLTRGGWRRVTWSGMTQRDAEVTRVETTAGSFDATVNHRVWAGERGFVRVDALVCGDRIGACPNVLRRSFSTASHSLGSLIQRLAQRGSTTPPTPTRDASRAWANFTLKSGRTPTEEPQFQMVTSSTTSITTRSTMIPATFAASPARSMPRYTSTIGSLTPPSGSNTWIPSGHSLPSGTEPRKGPSGTVVTLATRTPTGSTSPSPVSSAARSTPLGTPESPATAPDPASCESTRRAAGTRSLFRALSAVLSSFRASTVRCPQRAPHRVVRTYALAEKQNVYDLTVDSDPEFYANGVLVHNCVWGPWEMRLVKATSGGAGSWGGAAMNQKIG